MALDMKLHFTSGYHPKGDGQTEALIRPWNSTSGSTVTISRTTGSGCFHLWSSLTTTLQVQLPPLPCSMPTRGITQTLPSTRSRNWLPLTPRNLSPILTNYINTYENTWQQHNSGIKGPWTLLKPRLWNSRSGVGPTSRCSFSVLPVI